MDYSRILSVIDVAAMQRSHVSLVGAGGSASLATNLIRSGLGALSLADPQTIDASNAARQEHDQVGMLKVDALAQRIHGINAAARVTPLAVDFCQLTDQQIDEHFGRTDLFIFATDSFEAQARGNQVALRLRKPAMWIGLYRGGRAGEIPWWEEGRPCFQCLFPSRYKAQRSGQAKDPPSDGATLFDIGLLDSIAGMIAVGLLTRGAPNRFGRLIDQLGDRNFLQVKIDPTYTWNGRDVFSEQLGIPEDCPAYFSFCTIARSDPTHGEPPCPDCVRFLGRVPSTPAEALTLVS